MADCSMEVGDPSHIVGILLDMGFEKSRAQHAVATSGKYGLDAALHQLLEPSFSCSSECAFMDLTDSPIRPTRREAVSNSSFLDVVPLAIASRSEFCCTGDGATAAQTGSPIRPTRQEFASSSSSYDVSPIDHSLLSMSASDGEITRAKQPQSPIGQPHSGSASSSSSHNGDLLDSASFTRGIHGMDVSASVSESKASSRTESSEVPLPPLAASKSKFRNVSVEREAVRNEVLDAKQALNFWQKSLQQVQQPLAELQCRYMQAKKNMEDDANAVRLFMKSVSPSSDTAIGKVVCWVKNWIASESPMSPPQLQTLDRLQRNALQSSTEAESLREQVCSLEKELDVQNLRSAIQESEQQVESLRQVEQRLKGELCEKLQTSSVATIVCVAHAPEIAADVRFADLGKQVHMEWRVDLGWSSVPLTELETGEVAKAVPVELRRRDHLLEYAGAYCLVKGTLWSTVKRLQGAPAPLSSFELLRASCGEPVYQGRYLLQLIPGSQEFRQRVLGILHHAEVKMPLGLVKVLRPYQDTGIRWMAQLTENGLGCLLADDMGLGKTLQTIGMLAYLKTHNSLVLNGEPAPVLVIVPASLVSNWHRELEHWAPDLRARSFHGSQRSLLFHSVADVVLTTYETCRRNQEQLQRKSWSGVILDEAQRIKNSSSKTSSVVKALGRMASFRVALTGTPIENKLEELYSLMDFVNPGYLGGVEAFKKDFVVPLRDRGSKDKEGAQAQSDLLKNIISPFLLRRKKSDKALLPELPDRVDYDIDVDLTDGQRMLYEGVTEVFKQNMAKLKGDPHQKFKRGGLIFGVMNQLRLICGHPATLSECPEALRHLLTKRSAIASGKTARFMEIMLEILSAGEKAIVFVMRKSLMYLLKELLEVEHKVTVLTYSGDTPLVERPGIEERFRSEPSCQVMLLTIDAGGVGLNLCAANHVIHFDRCYNPAKENQATDRAHRMGQKQVVCVHKLIAKGTFEERLDQIVKRKAALGDVLDGLDVNFVSSYSDAEIIDLFSLRADAHSMQGDALKRGQKRKHSGWDEEVHLEEKENLDIANSASVSQEQLDEEDDRQCVVCLDSRLELLFIPCGHSCCCASCGKKLIQCPVCREDIGSKTFLNSSQAGAASSAT